MTMTTDLAANLPQLGTELANMLRDYLLGNPTPTDVLVARAAAALGVARPLDPPEAVLAALTELAAGRRPKLTALVPPDQVSRVGLELDCINALYAGRAARKWGVVAAALLVALARRARR